MKAADNMAAAILQAREALREGEMPVGAVVICGGKVLSAQHNRCEAKKDPTAHAEILAIRQAARELGDWRLGACTLYCTLEPCAMCAGALIESRIGRVVFGAYDPKMGAAGSAFDLFALAGSKTPVIGGLLEKECASLLTEAFRSKR